MFGQNCVIARDNTCCLMLLCLMWDVNNSMSGSNELAPNRHNSILCTDIGLPDKGSTIKGEFVCYVVWLRCMKEMVQAQSAWVWSFVHVRLAIELKYRNTPKKHNLTSVHPY